MSEYYRFINTRQKIDVKSIILCILTLLYGSSVFAQLPASGLYRCELAAWKKAETSTWLPLPKDLAKSHPLRVYGNFVDLDGEVYDYRTTYRGSSGNLVALYERRRSSEKKFLLNISLGLNNEGQILIEQTNEVSSWGSFCKLG